MHHHRFVVYIPKAEYVSFKEKLATEGLTVSGWVRKHVRSVLDGAKP